MFRSRHPGTVIAQGLKIAGNVTAEGHVEVHGQIEGEVQATSLYIARQAEVRGPVIAEQVVVDGIVEGPIHGMDVRLKAQARVSGDIHHRTLAIEKGARFHGRCVHENFEAPPKPEQ